MAAIRGIDIADQLFKAGILPTSKCRRIIIDIPCNGMVKIFYETIADERLLTLDMPAMLSGAAVVGVQALAASVDAVGSNGCKATVEVKQ